MGRGMNVMFLQELFSTITERGRGLLTVAPQRDGMANIAELCRALLSGRGEASGMALASEIVAAYGTLDGQGRLRFFELLKDEFGPDRTRLREASEVPVPLPCQVEQTRAGIDTGVASPGSYDERC